MKKINLLLVLLITLSTAFSQGVGISNNGQPADASAMLDISSTSKGLLIPRMRTDERTAIVSPSRGLIVYDSDTQSFWYFTGLTWKEILNNGSPILPMGPASGDLYGSYPSPNVGKIQNLDVAFGVPFDKQVMKWDALNNRWQGFNDSLFLPYNVTSGNPSRLFAITNANTTGGSSAIYGRSGIPGSSFSPGPSVGVWGDSQAGMGVNGTSNSGIGVSGASLQNHGISGLSIGNNYAGVYGNGVSVGVYGQTSDGIGIRGVSSFGKAGVFENNTTDNTDTLLKLVHSGTGRGISLSLTNSLNNSGALAINNAGTGQMINLYNSNTSNNAHLLYANQTGTGVGIYMSIANTFNTHPGVLVEHAGTGSGIESYGYKGKAALFQIPSATNANTALDVSTLGTGNAAVVNVSNTSNTNTALTASTNGNGSAAGFTITKATNSNPAVTVSNAGTGRGLESVLTNSSNNNAAVYASSPGQYGIYSVAKTTAVYGQATGLTGGIAIFGQAGLNNSDGIGVKGSSYSDLQNRGSVTGENNGNGVGVYGIAAGNDGIGVKGVGNSTGNGLSGFAVYGINSNGIAVLGEASGNNAVGVRGYSNASSGTGYGVQGFAFSNSIAGVYGSGFGPINGVLGESGSGPGVKGTSAGTSIALGSITGINSSIGIGVYGESTGGGYGVKGVNNAATRAAVLGVNSNGDGVEGVSNGNGNGISGKSGPPGATGAGVYGTTNITSTTGRAGLFEVNSASHTYEAVKIYNEGLGSTLYLQSTNTANSVTMVRVRMNNNIGDYMVFEDGAGNNEIRFNSAGKGFFNGGTQTGGADMAEAFDVEEERSSYEPGDVLIISVDKDRTVLRSKGPYSNLVAGVYATKPGILMTEENINTDISDKVPMGVVGVIPTKVCREGGEIKRGDILVTSSVPGVAMKGDIEKIKPGQIIGKALENYSSTGIGKIKVLVSVR